MPQPDLNANPSDWDIAFAEVLRLATVWSVEAIQAALDEIKLTQRSPATMANYRKKNQAISVRTINPAALRSVLED